MLKHAKEKGYRYYYTTLVDPVLQRIYIDKGFKVLAEVRYDEQGEIYSLSEEDRLEMSVFLEHNSKTRRLVSNF